MSGILSATPIKHVNNCIKGRPSFRGNSGPKMRPKSNNTDTCQSVFVSDTCRPIQTFAKNRQEPPSRKLLYGEKSIGNKHLLVGISITALGSRFGALFPLKLGLPLMQLLTCFIGVALKIPLI